jgi:WD40 repeat protein
MLRKLVPAIVMLLPLTGMAQSNLKLVVPLGHTQPVTAIAISQDDKLILSGGADNLVHLWETEAGRELKTYNAHANTIDKIVFSGKGNYFISRDRSGRAVLQQVVSGNVVETLEPKEIHAIPGADAFCWVTHGGDVRFWKAGDSTRTVSRNYTLTSALSPDGAYLLLLQPPPNSYYDYLSVEAQAVLVRLRDKLVRPLTKVKIALGTQLGFSPDGTSAFVGDDGNTIFEFATSTGVLKGKVPGNSIWIDDFDVSAEGILKFDGYDFARYWNLKTGSISFSEPVMKKGFELQSSNTGYRWEKDFDTGKDILPSVTFTAYSDGKSREFKTPVAVKFHQSKKIAIAKDKSVQIMDVATNEVTHELHGTSGGLAPTSLSFSDDNKVLGYTDGQLQLWDLDNGTPVLVGADEDTVTSVKFVSGKKFLVTGHDGKIKVRDAQKGSVIQVVSASENSAFGKVGNIQFSGDARLMLWSDPYGNYIKKWNWDDLAFYQEYKPLNVSYQIQRYGAGTGWSFQNISSAISFGKGANEFLVGVDVGDGFRNSYIFAVGLNDLLNGIQLTHPVQLSRQDDDLDVSFNNVDQISISPSGKSVFLFTPQARNSPRHRWTFPVVSRASFSDGQFQWRPNDIIFSRSGYSTTAKTLDLAPTSVSVHPSKDVLAVGAARDNAIYVVDPQAIAALDTLRGHSDDVTSLVFSPDGKLLASSSIDNTIKLWDIEASRELATLLKLGTADWVVIAPNGLFDASAGAMHQMYFSTGLQTIGLEQIKDRFYEPNLLKKLIAREPLREVSSLSNIDLYPYVQASIDTTSARLQIVLKNQGGGIGRTPVFINGKEAIEDARKLTTRSGEGQKEITISIDLSSNRNLLPGAENFIGVKSYNAAGYLSSPTKRLRVRLPQKSKLLEAYRPHLYAVIVGVSDYENDDLDLKYSSKDAKDFAFALETSAKKLFNDNIHITLLVSGGQDATKPTKKNIIDSFNKLVSVARPEDVLVVYFAGHGTNQSGEDGDFLYLTAEARTFSFADPAIRQRVALSSSELTNHLKTILAQKQVLIFDACASGRMVDNLIAKRDIPSGTLRALERMKDRTGTYIITGCAADAVSYEASQFRQGLLTHSLLSGMKGAALRDDRFVDVLRLFQYAREEVPRLAENIGGIQEPKVFSPYGGDSFDVGLLEESEKNLIPLTTPKPFVIRSSFQNDIKLRDDAGLSKHINVALAEYAQNTFVFLDVAEFPDALYVTGRYTLDGNKLVIKIGLFQNDKMLQMVERTYDSFDVNVLSADILKLIESSLGH